MTATLPIHGQLGDLTTYDRADGNVHARCVSRLRWCHKCEGWVGGKGIVSMVLAAVACPKCGSAWERAPVPAAPADDDECPF